MAASVQYWNNYVNSIEGPNFAPVPLPNLATPLINPTNTYNGAVAIEDAQYTLADGDTIDEKGLGVFVGFVLPALSIQNLNDLSNDPDDWLCVYAKIITTKRQKRNPYAKGPRAPRAPGAGTSLQLRAKKLTYAHEVPPVETWPEQDNRLIADKQLVRIAPFAGLLKPEQIDYVRARSTAWNGAASRANRAHLKNIRRHGLTVLPPL